MKSLKDHFKRTLVLAYPVVLGQLGFILMHVVDNLMVGALGAAPLAGASLANGIFILIYIIGVGVSFAVTPLVAISVGAGRYEECGVYFRQSLIVNLVLGLILMVIIFILNTKMEILNQPEEVLALAPSYGNLLAISILPMAWYQTFKQYIEGLSIMRPAMVVVILANLVNVFFNWLLIYGNWGFPQLGLDGAGYATIISRIFMAASLSVFVLGSAKFNLYDTNLNFKSLNFPVIKKILRLGLPSGFQHFFEVGAFVSAVFMVGWLGTEQLAAHQIVINLASITFMVSLGLSAAGGIRVGNAVGREDISETRRAGFTALYTAVGFMILAGLMFVILRDYLPTLYIDNQRVITMASSLLVIAALFQVSDGVQAVGIGILRGLTDVKIPTIIAFFSYWVLGLPSAYLLGFTFKLEVVGVWIGLLIGLTAAAFLLTFRFNYKSKQRIEI